MYKKQTLLYFFVAETSLHTERKKKSLKGQKLYFFFFVIKWVKSEKGFDGTGQMMRVFRIWVKFIVLEIFKVLF